KEGGYFMRRLVWLAGVLLAFVFIVPLPAKATFPGANGRIAFSSDFSDPSQIYTMRSDGTDLRQLTHVSAGHAAVSPAWSPDGTRIAFTLNNRIWVMNADGAGKQKLTHRDGFEDHSPSWSPDGTQILFSRCDVSFGFEAYCDIDLMSSDGTGLTKILGGN